MQLGEKELRFQPMKISDSRKSLWQLSGLITRLVPSDKLGEAFHSVSGGNADKVFAVLGQLKTVFADESALNIYISLLTKLRETCKVCSDGKSIPLDEKLYGVLFHGKIGEELEFFAEGIVYHFSDFLHTMQNVVKDRTGEEGSLTVKSD